MKSDLVAPVEKENKQKRRAFFRKTRLDVTDYYSLGSMQAMI
ncbi:MAG: hypothetical protein NTZ64_13715 [Polaromonas sp.]|nr:hypothetical protein [Polaromonas sp.]